MFLSVKEMEVRRVGFDETFPAGQIDFSGEYLVQTSPLHAAGSAELLENTQGEMRIQGRYSVEVESECDRCLGRARFPLDNAFDLFYQPAAAVARVEEVEIDEGEAEIGFYENGGIELEDILQEQILLALPMQKVCSEQCKGICPVCGRNRNQAECQCRPAGGSDRWHALGNLK